jgi:hypothetical protein
MQTELSERTSEYDVGTINVVESLPKTLLWQKNRRPALLFAFCFCALCFFISSVVLDLEKCS